MVFFFPHPNVENSGNPCYFYCMIRIILFIFSLFSSIYLSGQSDWELRKDKDGITIYTRTPEGTNIKEYRVSAEIKSPPSEVYEFLTDLEYRPEWVIKCMGLEIIDTVENHIRYHTGYDIPWPVSDRDLVVETESVLKDSSGMSHLLTVGIDIDFPIEKGTVRMEKYREEVFLEEVSSTTTLFRAEGFADPGGNIPAWIINMFLVDGIFDSMVKTRELLVKE
jgi:hypothetical protein